MNNPMIDAGLMMLTLLVASAASAETSRYEIRDATGYVFRAQCSTEGVLLLELQAEMHNGNPLARGLFKSSGLGTAVCAKWAAEFSAMIARPLPVTGEVVTESYKATEKIRRECRGHPLDPGPITCYRTEVVTHIRESITLDLNGISVFRQENH